jgi:hypothetical protein
MSRNGSGTYSLPAGNPVVSGTTVTTTWANTTLNDIASSLTGSVASDGQTPMTGALNMGSNKITTVTDPTNAQDAATKAYVDAATSGLSATYLTKANNLSDVANATTSRTNLGLGTIATQAASAVAVTGGAIDGTTVGTTTRSTVKATTLDLGLSTQSVAIGQGNASIMKNRIINGAMVINQRATSITDNGYSVDRFQYVASVASKGTLAQSTSIYPTGFNYSLGFTSSSAYTVGASELFTIKQVIEGYNVADLGFGTANAKTITISFWVRSSLTGTFGGSINNSAGDRSYPFSYTISAANTWEQKSVTIAGDTTGTWLVDNGAGLNVWFSLGAGSTFSATAGAWGGGGGKVSATGATSVVGTNGATFYITGVQLEVGSSATGYEYRQYTTELALCQRYYYALGGNTGDLNSITGRFYAASGVYVANQYQFPVQMRTSATMTVGGTFVVTNCGQPISLHSGDKTWAWQALTSGTGGIQVYSNNSGFMTFNAEL